MSMYRYSLLKGISSIEEFANVATDIVLDTEFTSGMLSHKFGNIEDHIVQNN